MVCSSVLPSVQMESEEEKENRDAPTHQLLANIHTFNTHPTATLAPNTRMYIPPMHEEDDDEEEEEDDDTLFTSMLLLSVWKVQTWGDVRLQYSGQSYTYF